ncbi:hypothetical protein [Microbulbifer sp. ZKSA002]|uniref:hypothetical protein n=1 Tax=Microbulbifer sp. ZKSA002 TaxID=3243388 RepID=UPI004039E4DA
MLIRIETGELIEIPEELGALVLIDPFSSSSGQPEFSAEEVNALVHSILGTYFDSELSREENINKVKEIYAQFEPPSAEALSIARKSIEAYVKEIESAQVGMIDGELVDLMFIDNTKQRLG